MGRPDDDTAKVVIRENRRVEYQSVLVAPGTRMELQIDVSEPMTGGILYVSLDVPGADVVVEHVAIGQFVIVPGPVPTSDWLAGKTVRDTVCPKCPLRILLVSRDKREVKVGASLVTTAKPGTYKIVNKG